MEFRLFFFCFQAEDGIRDATVTGVQTCALPILAPSHARPPEHTFPHCPQLFESDRKSTRLNSSHGSISYAVFCLKKNKHTDTIHATHAEPLFSRVHIRRADKL